MKITSGGICGSDIGIYNGTNSLATYPRVIGHEFGGIVEEVGSGVSNIKPGDKVAVDPVVSCGHCYACRINRHNVCSTLEVMGVHRDGGFAEYVVAAASNVHKFHKEIVLVTEENLEERLDKFTDGEGIPVIVDTVCIPTSFEQCVQLACPAGRIVVIGLKISLLLSPWLISQKKN